MASTGFDSTAFTSFLTSFTSTFFSLSEELSLESSDPELEDDAYFLAAAFLGFFSDDSLESLESSEEVSGFLGAYFFGCSTAFLACSDFLTGLAEDSLLSESSLDELSTILALAGMTAFSAVFLTFVPLLSLFPLTLEEVLGLLVRISFLGGSSEDESLDEEEELTYFLLAFFLSGMTGATTFFFTA